MPVKKTDAVEKKAKTMEVDIKEQVADEEKVIVRYENLISGKCDYYTENGKYPKIIGMNKHVFKKMLILGNIDNDNKCLGADVIIDNKIDNSTVILK